MIILGIETTAHTFGVGIVTDKGDILANVTNSYTSPDKGMVPNEIVDHHNKVAEEVLQKALDEAKVTWNDTKRAKLSCAERKNIPLCIEFISYSAGPGLDPALWAGYHKAKEWSKKYNKKLVGINHCAAHLSVGNMYNGLKDPCYLYVSGVNTQIIVQENGKYKVIGETLDIGLGNMLDKFGRVLKLGFPAGPEIEKLSLNGKYVELPYIVKGMDTSFSGILTRARQLFEKGLPKEDICFSVQETCFAMLTEVVERAIAQTGKNELLLVGGVGANKRFCDMLKKMCEDRSVKFYRVPIDLARDNGAMIAWEGFLRKDSSGDIEVNPHWRIDEVYNL